MGTDLENRLRDAFAAVTRMHQPDVAGRFADFQTRSTGTGARRRVRLIAAPLVAAAAIIAIILGTAYLRADRDEHATPVPPARPSMDPWAPPPSDPRDPQPFGAGERLELVRTERETVAVTAAGPMGPRATAPQECALHPGVRGEDEMPQCLDEGPLSLDPFVEQFSSGFPAASKACTVEGEVSLGFGSTMTPLRKPPTRCTFGYLRPDLVCQATRTASGWVHRIW